jgi:hypothetical protein
LASMTTPSPGAPDAEAMDAFTEAICVVSVGYSHWTREMMAAGFLRIRE